MVDLVLAKASGAYLDDVSSAVRIFDLGSQRVFASLRPLVRYLRRERPRAMLSALNHANVVAIWAARLARTGTRVVVSERATLSLMQRSSKRVRQGVLPLLMRFSYPSAAKVVAVSHGVADDLATVIGLPRDRIEVVYNPVVTASLVSRSREKPQHRWFAGADAPPVVLAVGRLGPEKDFPVLIRAFALLRAQRDVRLIILGEGAMRAELAALIRELGLQQDVDLPGFAANPFAFMRCARLCVLSSRTEGLPGVLIEALACGAPVVSTDCPNGPREILEGGKWGALVPVGDAAAMAREMANALDRHDGPEVALRAKDFSVEHAVNRYLDVLGIERT
jgi:glycosyltransferase involved in cell wall biosynthesis